MGSRINTKTSKCKGLNMNNTFCKRNTTNESGFCPSHHHQSKIKTSHLEESQCSICLEVATAADALECGHMIHRNCLRQTYKAECPVCRTELINIPFRVRQIIERNAYRHEEENNENRLMSLVFNLIALLRREQSHIVDGGFLAYYDDTSEHIRIYF